MLKRVNSFLSLNHVRSFVHIFQLNALMKRFPIHLLSVFILPSLLTLTAASQQAAKNNMDYAAGYREYKAADSSRRYKPDAVMGDRLYNRPEEIDVWYPAGVGEGARPLEFFYFLSLFERRANSFQDSVKYQGLAQELMQHFTIGSDKPSTSLKTASFLNAAPVAGKFPLLLYLSSYNGMSYENIPLFEELARHGYVVVSISSVGRYPGNMSTKYPDVAEQVKDAEFAINYLAKKGADTSQIGLVGYSYGGIAAVMLAARHASVKGILSLDGSEKHYYGKNQAEDLDFDQLRHSLYWKPSAMNAPYAYLESDHKQEDGPADSVYHLPLAQVPAYGRLTGAEHEDFSGIAMVTKPGSAYGWVERLTLDFFDHNLKEQNRVFDTELRNLASAGKLSFTTEGATPAIGQITLSGSIADAANGKPLSYVTIGIPSGNCGTVTDDHGRFTLRVPDTLAGRIVRISSLGYQTQSYPVRELLASLKNGSVLSLREQVTALKEVTISAVKLRTRIIGNTSQSKFFNVGFPFRDLGSELGIKIALGKKKVLLRRFNFNISATRMDSCTFRLNIYALKDGMPSENLLKQNIINSIGNKPGTYTIDLMPYHIQLEGTVLVSLEWIGGKASSGNGAVFFSAGMLSSSYHRKTAEADWTKFKGLGAAFNLEVSGQE